MYRNAIITKCGKVYKVNIELFARVATVFNSYRSSYKHSDMKTKLGLYCA